MLPPSANPALVVTALSRLWNVVRAASAMLPASPVPALVAEIGAGRGGGSATRRRERHRRAERAVRHHLGGDDGGVPGEDDEERDGHAPAPAPDSRRGRSGLSRRQVTTAKRRSSRLLSQTSGSVSAR